LHALAIAIRAVGLAQILDLDGFTFKDDPAMLAGDVRERNAEIAIFATTDNGHVSRDRETPALSIRPKHDHYNAHANSPPRHTLTKETVEPARRSNGPCLLCILFRPDGLNHRAGRRVCLKPAVPIRYRAAEKNARWRVFLRYRWVPLSARIIAMSCRERRDNGLPETGVVVSFPSPGSGLRFMPETGGSPASSMRSVALN